MGKVRTLLLIRFMADRPRRARPKVRDTVIGFSVVVSLVLDGRLASAAHIDLRGHGFLSNIAHRLHPKLTRTPFDVARNRGRGVGTSGRADRLRPAYLTMSLNDPPLLRARLFSRVQTRDAVASGDARGSGSFLGRRGREEVVSVDLGLMPRGLRVCRATIKVRQQRQSG